MEYACIKKSTNPVNTVELLLWDIPIKGTLLLALAFKNTHIIFVIIIFIIGTPPLKEHFVIINTSTGSGGVPSKGHCLG